MKRYSARLLAILIAIIPIAAFATPPTVIKATPDNGAENVDPATTQLLITFDQPMARGFSFVGGGDNFPGSGARAHWIDSKTCVLPLKLKPEHDYTLSINNATFQNFRNLQGEPAVPYPISFSTSGATTEPSLTPEANDAAVTLLRQALRDDYSYIDLHKVDWDQAFADAAASLREAKTARQFAKAAGKVLAKANDNHIWLTVGDQIVPAAIRRVDPNCDVPLLMRLVPNLTAKNNMVLTGKFDDGIAYIMIRNFSGDESILAPAMDALADAPAVIIDVRTNSGGNELLAQSLAGCFVASPQIYAKDIIRQDGKESSPLDRVLTPNSARPTFAGKVMLLIGPGNMSSCESFIMMMKTSANCTTIGQKTWGSSGNPKPHDLGNGVAVLLPSWRDLRPDGSCIEGVGLTPDVPVDGGGSTAGDPVLDRALTLLRQTP